jgi:hypothetical protein
VGREREVAVGSILAAVDGMALATRGSVPLVLRGSLRALGPGAVGELLERLELEAERVQLVVVTDHDEAAGWAEGVGPGRAAVAGRRPARD